MSSTVASQQHILSAIERRLHHKDFVIESHVTEEVTEKMGLLANHAFARVTVFDKSAKTERALSFFLKIFPREEAVATFARGAGAFPREEFVYETLDEFRLKGIDIMDSCTCQCYGFEPSGYIILEDLEAQGYRTPDKSQCLDYDTMLLVLRHMAQFHAASLIYEEIRTKETGETFRIINGNEERLRETLYDDSEGFANKDTLTSALNCVLTQIRYFNFPEILEKSGKQFEECVKEFHQMIFPLVKPSHKHRNVLCHGDLWASNFLLKQDQHQQVVGCKLVDFQSVRSLRQERMYEALGVYYSYLEKSVRYSGLSLKNLISFEDFLESCEEQKLFSVIFAAEILPLVLGDRGKIEQYFNDAEMYRKVFREDRSVLVSDNAHNEWYIARLKESIEDLRDECEKYF
ncbi:hypothetical protein GWI33_017851 [Rhynchophorus ferrugineus]|uniref:CHK kinase-like domain-containing protein n=1 Tax=Rhynchophorus ferrugineus TaxID=354439 RepID=A0A834M5V3_RHYFE|nr:hypothetical protein GWI33_017851 [Rhynchophorus ferrugineus]